MKKLSVLLYVILILSILSCIINCVVAFERRDWIETTAIITSVSLPDGIVNGTFTDSNNIIRDNVNLYQDNKFTVIGAFKKGANPELYIGTETKIVYNPDNDEIEQSNKTKLMVSAIALVISITLLCLTQKHKRNAYEK